MNRYIILLVFFVFSDSYADPIRVIDAQGTQLLLDAPAERVIVLAPNLVENVASAGGFDKLIAVVEYSTYPVAAKALPRIGSYRNFNYEQIVALKPDLVIAWRSGNGDNIIKKLRSLGLKVLVTDSRKLIDVAHNIRLLGQVLGTSAIANSVADDYQQRLQQLQRSNRHKVVIDSFYQVWHRPLRALTGGAPVSQIIELCGGRNIYASELGVAPIINIESIIEHNPDAIIASQADGVTTAWQSYWQTKWSDLYAVRNGHLINLPSDESKRPTVRLLEAAEVLCQSFDQIRRTKLKLKREDSN